MGKSDRKLESTEVSILKKITEKLLKRKHSTAPPSQSRLIEIYKFTFCLILCFLFCFLGFPPRLIGKTGPLLDYLWGCVSFCNTEALFINLLMYLNKSIWTLREAIHTKIVWLYAGNPNIRKKKFTIQLRSFSIPNLGQKKEKKKKKESKRKFPACICLSSCARL